MNNEDERAHFERRMSAILAADVAGYSRLMGRKEEDTLLRLKTHRNEIVDPSVAKHRGRIVKTTGDGVLVEFASALDAVRSAIEIQGLMAVVGAGVAPEERIAFRIGIHLGDIMIDDGDIFGDDVNIASRLEQLAEPGGICISHTVRDYVRDKLALTFTDRGERTLKNIVHPIHVFGVQYGEATARPSSKETGQVEAPMRLSMVVLPFTNLSNDPEQEYFADSLVEDLTTDLSRIAGSFVIARNTAFTYKGKAVDAKQLGHDLNVIYMLEGSVRRVGNQVRINAQLIDTRTGGHVWADRFDGRVDDLFALQDSITSHLATTLSVELIEDAARQASKSANPDSIDLVMRGRAAALRPRSKQHAREAQDYYEQALKLAPDLADAKTGLAEVLVGMVLSLLGTDREAELAQAARMVSEALIEQPNSAWAHYVKGEVLRCQRHIGEASLEYQRAIALNRNFSAATANLAYAKILVGEPDEALPLLQRAIQMSPRDPLLAIWHSRIGQAEMYLEHYERAQTDFETSVRLNPDLIWNHFYLAGVYALTAENAKASTSLARAQQLSNDLNSVARYKAVSQISHPQLEALRDKTLIAGLRLAGLPNE